MTEEIQNENADSKQRVLVVDDEASIRRILETRLKMVGYDVVTAEDGEEAVEVYNKTAPDLVILDVMMPKMDGYGVTREIRRTSDVPIIILTALGDVSERITGLELGADDYVIKPFSPKELIARIKAVTKRFNNLDDMYIYSISYTDDFLATGLTNTDYSYTEEKMAFKENEDGQLEMSVGNFIKHENINISTENEYLKIDVKDRIVNYATEEYTIRFTNRTNYDIVISDYVEESEITLSLSNEVRGAEQHEDIVLGSNETKDIKIIFSKYVDDKDNSKFINFNNIRVLEDYYGEFSENTVVEDNIINAIAKFSMNVAVNR